MSTAKADIKSIFGQAMSLSSPEERAVYLQKACGGDPALRAEIESLLKADREAGSFLVERKPSLAATVDVPVQERPSMMIGPYKLLQPIGEGGMGVVWMAEQEEPVRRKVALKIIKPGLDSRQVIARFEAERQALALMDHHNIAKVLDAGTTESGRPYFVMELIHGVPITQYCDDSQLTPRERLELFVPVCQAIQHAHQKGIIHRDIKPSNVLVTLYDGKPVPKVIDFGVAKAVEQRLTEQTLFTQYGTILGTFEYMSPEQAEMSALGVDTRSDIYSLGVLLYELLTGTTPLERQRLRTASYPEIVRLIREEEPVKPSTQLSRSKTLASVAAARKTEPTKLAKLFRGELDWIVMKALEKDRNRRYENASSLAADVQRYLHDEPVHACPPSASYRLSKFARRNKAILGITGLVLFFLVLIGGGVGYGVRDRSARQTKLNLEIDHALDDAAKGRELALKLTDNPYAWEAALAAAKSELKRAEGLATQDETALEPVLQERLQAMQNLLNSDEADRRFAARFEEIRLQQSDAHPLGRYENKEIAFPALKEAFQHHYRITFAITPIEQAVAMVRDRPKAMQDVLSAALAICLDYVPKDDPQMRLWLEAVQDGADDRPWRRRTQKALKARDWKALEQIFAEAAAARQPPSVLLQIARDVPSASPIRLRLFRRIQEAYPGDFWANHDLADLLFFSETPQYEEARRYYTAALALRPHNAGMYFKLGAVLGEKGPLDEALACYRKAIEIDPRYTFAHNRLGADLGNLGRVDEAIPCFRKAIECDPKFVLAYYNLGIALCEKGRPDEAMVCLRKAIEISPNDGGCRDNLAWILINCADLKHRNLAEGLELAQKTVELAPSVGDYWSTLGAAHYRAGNWKEANAALEKSMQLRNGGDGFDWCFLAMICWQRGEKEKARQWFDKAVQWMDEKKPKDIELGHIRAETAELLKIEGKKK